MLGAFVSNVGGQVLGAATSTTTPPPGTASGTPVGDETRTDAGIGTGTGTGTGVAGTGTGIAAASAAMAQTVGADAGQTRSAAGGEANTSGFGNESQAASAGLLGNLGSYWWEILLGFLILGGIWWGWRMV